MRYVVSADIWGVLLILAVLIAIVAVPVWLLYAARRDRRRWRSALREMPTGALLFDSRGRQLFSNRQGEALLPLIANADADTKQATLLRQVQQVLESGLLGAHGSATVSTALGGSVQVESWPVGDARKPRWVLLTLRDTGEQQQVANSYRKFLYSASHELLTPLTAVRGHLAHIESSAGRNSALWLSSLHVARDEIERLTRLISNLLLLSRLEGGQPSQRQPTNLTTVVEEASVDLLAKAGERQMTINIQAAPALPRLSLDRDAWKQVFINLIDNAIKYGKEGDTVGVSLDSRGGEVLIVVSDSGAGIAPQDLPHIFEEMYRAAGRRDVSGSGLGLAIVRRIVEQHGGQITCRSGPGEKTVFEIKLPVTKP